MPEVVERYQGYLICAIEQKDAWSANIVPMRSSVAWAEPADWLPIAAETAECAITEAIYQIDLQVGPRRFSQRPHPPTLAA